MQNKVFKIIYNISWTRAKFKIVYNIPWTDAKESMYSCV